jgi:hypothetical protein
MSPRQLRDAVIAHPTMADNWHQGMSPDAAIGIAQSQEISR